MYAYNKPLTTATILSLCPSICFYLLLKLKLRGHGTTTQSTRGCARTMTLFFALDLFLPRS